MSSKAYQEAYSSMTEKQRDIMCYLYMKAENHDGHAWNMYCDIEDAVAGIVKEQIASAKPDVPDINVGDMISRQAAIETVRKAQSIGQAHRMLVQLPPAQPGWIPCTPETMPKMTDIYLVKVGINQYGEGMYPTFRTALWHTASRKWFVHESENSIIGEVTEWMPIPWEGGQDEQN